MALKSLIPPHNLDAEKSVLAAILLDKDAIIAVSPLLKPEHFYQESHAKIYEAMLTLYEQRDPIDLITLSNQLKKSKALEAVGGKSFLSDLFSVVPTAVNAETHGRIVKDSYTKRQLIATSNKLMEMSFDESFDTKILLDRVEQDIFGISQAHLTKNFVPVKELLTESFDRLDEIQRRGAGLRGIATGFFDLDQKLAGLQDSNLIVLAARPGVGKSTLALNIAHYAALKHQVPVGFFSLEMSSQELIDRLLIAQADIDAWKLKTGKLSDEDFDNLQEAMGMLAETPIFIDDTPGISILEMRTKARRLQSEHNLKLLIVDYLQLVDPGKRYDSRVVEVSMVSQSLKNLARELKIPVLAVSQLSRAVEVRGDKVPQLADLRESGAIEQDADVVMFIYRPDEKDDEAESKKSSAVAAIRLKIAKHRNGPTGEIELKFRGDRVRFHSTEHKRPVPSN